MKQDEVKMRLKINLDTDSAVLKFVSIATTAPSSIKLEVVDCEGMRVNARSLIGMMYAMTFEEIWLESNCDVYTMFSSFAVN